MTQARAVVEPRYDVIHEPEHQGDKAVSDIVSWDVWCEDEWLGCADTEPEAQAMADRFNSPAPSITDADVPY
jgi:hypothetical protein